MSQYPTNIHFFVDHDTSALPNSEKFAPNFQAPKNYKKPEAISEYIDAAAQAFMQEAAELPYLSAFASGAVVDSKGAVLIHGGPDSMLEFFDKLRLSTEFSKHRIVLVGFDTSRFWTSLATTLAMGGKVSTHKRLPAQLWDYRNYRGMDDLLGVSANVPRATVLKRLCGEDAGAGGIGNTPALRAKMAWRLCCKLQCLDDLEGSAGDPRSSTMDLPFEPNVKTKKKLKPLKKAKKS